MNWLNQLDPNAVLGALTLISTIGTWVYHKLRGDKVKSFGDTIAQVLNNFVPELLDTYASSEDIATFMGRARKFIESKAWMVLSKRGVPRNKLTEGLLHQGVEKVVAEIGNRAAQLRLPTQLSNLNDAAQRLLQAFQPPQGK